MPRDLESLGRSRFSELTIAELKLLRESPKGQSTYCGPTDPKDPANDPSNGDKWSKDREIRADLIRWLYVDQHARELVDPSGIVVFGAKIVGRLDLMFVTGRGMLGLRQCRLMQDADLSFMEIPEFDLSGSQVRSLWADGAKVGHVVLSTGFHSEGEVRLIGAQIGQLDCIDARFVNRPKPGDLDVDKGRALYADSIHVTLSVIFRGLNAEGSVRLLGAQIGGDLDCTGATLLSRGAEDGGALIADGAVVKGNVSLRDGFCADGKVSFARAQIQGDLTCAHATFLTMWLDGAQIGGNFVCANNKLNEVRALGAIVKGAFSWTDISSFSSTECIRLQLVNASVGALVDDTASWPASGDLALDGFVYGRISGGPTDATIRLGWLARQKEYTLQPYVQLAQVLRDAGDERGAKQVLVEMERRQKVGWSELPWKWLFRTVGYGYYPTNALWGLLAFSGLGWLIYRRAYLAGTMTPTEKGAYGEYRQSKSVPPHYSRFCPLVYSVETVFPLVKLGQANTWQPDPNIVSSQEGFKNLRARFVRWISAGNWRTRFQNWATSPPILRRFTVILVLIGWLLATLFLVGVTGLVRKF